MTASLDQATFNGKAKRKLAMLTFSCCGEFVKKSPEDLKQITLRIRTIYFFQNEGIFVQLDELDELDKITHAWIRIHYSLT